MPRRLNFDPSQGVRDGSWMVDPRVVEKYRAQGIDALNDPAHADDDVARDIEANRMEYSQARNRMRQNKVNAYNDENWGGEAQAAGYGNWRQSRRAAMKAYQADPVRFWQMAGNGGGGNMNLQPTADDLERFSHWLWITNPANQAEVMKAYKGPQTPVAPAAPPPTLAPQTPGVINTGYSPGQRPPVNPLGTTMDPMQPATNRIQPNTNRPMQPAPVMGAADVIKQTGYTGPMGPPQPAPINPLGTAQQKPSYMPQNPSTPSQFAGPLGTSQMNEKKRQQRMGSMQGTQGVF